MKASQLARLVSVLALSTIGCASVPTRQDVAAHDLLIVNARIVDGTGNPWYRGVVGVSGDRISYVGSGVPGLTGRRIIDAKDHVVAPGFIDMLGHSESSILRGPHAVSKITQGITSEITGEVQIGRAHV